MTKTTALSSDTFQDVENLNGKQSVAIFHVTISVKFKGTKCNSNGFSYDISRTIRSRIKKLDYLPSSYPVHYAYFEGS